MHGDKEPDGLTFYLAVMGIFSVAMLVLTVCAYNVN